MQTARGTRMFNARLVSILSLVLVLAGCTMNPTTGRRQLILVSSAETAAMGEQAAPQMVQEFGGEVQSVELRGYVNGVGRDLLEHVRPEYADLNWQFFTLDSEVINAFALPGGKIFITRGLLTRFENEAQVAGVLGHEIGHVVGRHVDERLSHAIAAEIGLELLSEYTESELITAGSGVLTQVALLGYSRRDESESDRLGVELMVAAGYDPMGMAEVIEVLEAASHGHRPPEWLSTHPYPENRHVDVMAMIRGPYQHTQNSASFVKRRDRFEARAKPHL